MRETGAAGADTLALQKAQQGYVLVARDWRYCASRFPLYASVSPLGFKIGE